MFVLLEKITEDGLDTLKNLIEFAAYDLSEQNGSNLNERGSFIRIASSIVESIVRIFLLMGGWVWKLRYEKL